MSLENLTKGQKSDISFILINLIIGGVFAVLSGYVISILLPGTHFFVGFASFGLGY